MGEITYQFENGDFHHTLVEIGRFVLDDFDGDDFMGFDVLTFDDLSKSALSKDVQDEIPGS